MAYKAASELSHNLAIKIDSIENTRKRMDKLFLQRKIYRKDVEHLYEGIFLKAVTSFESYLESLFLGVLHEKYKFPKRKTPARAVFSSRQVATDIVLAGKQYVEWMPYSHLRTRAEIFYEKGEPFTTLNQPEKDILSQIVAIRNAIAHNSPYAKRKFQEQIVDTTAGLPEEHSTPAGFLRYIYRTAPDQTKFENYMIELLGIASKISSYS